MPHHCDPHLNQTKLNDLLPLTIDDVLGFNSVAAFDSIFALSSALFLLSVSLIQIRTVLYNTDTDIGLCLTACLDYTLMDYSHLDYRHLDYL